MTKEDFITFIKELGFSKTWSSNTNLFYLNTDQITSSTQNQSSFKIISILIESESRFQMSVIDSFSSFRNTEFGTYLINTFDCENDPQIELFFSFICQNFDKIPEKIISNIRDRRIDKVLFR